MILFTLPQYKIILDHEVNVINVWESILCEGMKGKKTTSSDYNK